MSSENDNDVLNIDDSQEDVISWDSIIDTDEDGIVSIKDNSSGASSSGIETEVFSNETDSSDINAIKDMLGDVDVSTVDSSESDEIDEEELKRILSGDNSNDAAQDIAAEDEEVSIDFDDSISNNDDVQIADSEEISPRINEVKKSQVPSPLIIALIFAVIVAGGAYFAFNFFSSSNDDSTDSIDQVAMQQMMNNQMNGQGAEGLNGDQAAIPVVNENEVSEIKPDEQANEEKNEKKEVVNVVPTGRLNPFMPLSKFKYVPEPIDIVTKYKTINNIDYDSFSIPKPPKKYGELNEQTKKLMSVGVSGIMYDKVKPSAIIKFQDNDYFVQIGDKLDKFRVVGITPTQVNIALGKNIYSAKVGEEIKVDLFYGNVMYKDGGKQYYSDMKEFMEDNNIKELPSSAQGNNDMSQSGGAQGGGGRFPNGGGAYTSENDIGIIPR